MDHDSIACIARTWRHRMHAHALHHAHLLSIGRMRMHSTHLVVHSLLHALLMTTIDVFQVLADDKCTYQLA